MPSELRDEVYTYLWDDETVNKVRSLWDQYSSIYGREEGRRGDKLACPIIRKDCVCNISSDLPIFARSSYASDIAAEAISIFFRDLACLTLYTKDIEEHLGDWFFAIGVQARNYIRHLRVRIDTDLLDWELRMLDKELEQLDCPPYKEITAREDAALKENLTCFSTIKPSKGFRLELIFSNKIQLTSALLRILEIIKPIFRTLVDERKFKITILPTIENSWRIRNDVASRRTSHNRAQSHDSLYTPKDLRAYFDVTPNERLLTVEARDIEVS
jgi:hypothetical protein